MDKVFTEMPTAVTGSTVVVGWMSENYFCLVKGKSGHFSIHVNEFADFFHS